MRFCKVVAGKVTLETINMCEKVASTLQCVLNLAIRMNLDYEQPVINVLRTYFGMKQYFE